jgi:hypothetical protein
MSQHCVALQVFHRGGSAKAPQKLAEAMPDAEVGQPDEDGIIEVRLDAPDFEEALHLVWNGIASAGCDDHIAFAEHPDIPEHWKRPGYDGPPGALA